MKSSDPCRQGLIITFVAFLIIPASTSFAQQEAGVPTSFPGIKVVSPAQGATVRPGEDVPVNLEIDQALNPGFVLIMGNIFRTGISLEMQGPPFHGTMKIPTELAGPVELMVLVKDTADKTIGGLALNINVIPIEVPQSIDPISTHYYLDLPPASFIGSRAISVRGTYDNDTERDISDTSTGTRYRSSNTSVVTVNDKGVMEPVAPGSAFVIVEHRGLKGFVAVDVEEKGKRRKDFPPVDHTADVSIAASPPHHKEGTVRYEMDVVIRNDADLPLDLPLHLVITGLADGVRVADASETSHAEPVGSPYVFVDVDERSYLSPGNSARATVTFINFDRKPLDHQLRLYAGGDP